MVEMWQAVTAVTKWGWHRPVCQVWRGQSDRGHNNVGSWAGVEHTQACNLCNFFSSIKPKQRFRCWIRCVILGCIMLQYINIKMLWVNKYQRYVFFRPTVSTFQYNINAAAVTAEYLYSMVIFRFPSLFIKATFIFVMLTLLAILKTFYFWIVLWHWFIESLDQLSRSKWFEYWIEQGRCIEFQLSIYLQNLHLFRFPAVLWTEQTHLAVR